MRASQRRRSIGMLAALCVLSSLFFACGKKGDPTLTSFEIPIPPSSLTAIHREGVITIRWDYPRTRESSIAEFIVMRSSGVEFEKISHVSANMRTFVDSTVKIGDTYRYKVISQNFRGVYSGDSNTVEAAPVQPPVPPTKIAYVIKDATAIISWEPLGADIRYNIFKADEKGAYGLTPLNPAPLADPVFRDAFSVNKTARYTVRSLRGGTIRDEGPASSELIVDPADLVPSQPQDLRAYPAQDGVYLSWAEFTEPWVTGFRIYKRVESGHYVLTGQTQIPSFLDKGPSDLRRDYRVTAVGPGKEGPAAEIQNVMFIPQQ